MTVLRSGSATDVGKVRTSNQDVALEDPDLYAVADGMGGHVGGEVAARVAIDSLRSSFQREPTVEGLRHAVAAANQAVWRQGQSESGLRGMGTTLTATALVRDEGGREVIALANVGDSRAYVFKRGQVIQVTADHSLAEEKVRQGELTEAEAAVHPHRHILTRALGVSSDVDVDLWELHLSQGDRILLCSDGLTNELDDDRIRTLLASVPDPTEAAGALVRAAVEHGGSDNVTVVIVDVVDIGTDAEGDIAPALAHQSPEQDDHQAQESQATAGGTGMVGDPPGSHSAGSGESGADDATGVVSAISSAGSRRQAATGTITTLPARTRVSAGSSSSARTGTVPPASSSEARSPIGLQASELRKWQPSRKDRRRRRRSAGVPRLITVRVVLFLVLVLAVVAAAYGLVRWYALDDWYVGVDHGHLAVYQGRPGGFLWFRPQLVDETAVTTKEVLPFRIPALRQGKQYSSESAARRYVTNLHEEYLATRTPGSASTTQSVSGPAAKPAASTATTTST